MFEKRAVLCLQHEALGGDGPFDVDALGMHRPSHGRLGSIIGDIDALLAAVEADPDEGNGHAVVILRAVVDQGLMIVRRQLFEGRQQWRVVCGFDLHESVRSRMFVSGLRPDCRGNRSRCRASTESERLTNITLLRRGVVLSSWNRPTSRAVLACRPRARHDQPSPTGSIRTNLTRSRATLAAFPAPP